MADTVFVPHVIPCCCAWTDLLGFGNIYSDYNWSLSAIRADYTTRYEAFRRGYAHLDRLYKLLSMTHMTIDPAYERALTVNDGVARNVDFNGPIINPLPFLCWIRETIFKHEFYCRSPNAGADNPGTRTVVTAGDRTDFGFPSSRLSDLYHLAPEHDEIFIHSPPAFQNNLAFAKAYLIESSLTKSRTIPRSSTFVRTQEDLAQELAKAFPDVEFYEYPAGPPTFRSEKNLANYFMDREFIKFLISRLNGLTVVIPSYYVFSDETSPKGPITVTFSIYFANEILIISASVLGKERPLLGLLFDPPLHIDVRGLSTDVFELRYWCISLLEDYRGPICGPSQI